MNHFKTGNAFFAQGSYKSNKYNGKELQETGMYSYGWREYMPDIGKWNGIDQLAESYLSASPYAYVLNNPINMFDPDGRETAPWSAMWEATPDGTNSYWFNDGRGFTSYDGGGGGGSLPYSSHVSYGGAFTMGDWTYALPPIIIKGQGTASTWNMGSNYFPNAMAMMNGFMKASENWTHRVKAEDMAWTLSGVRADGGVVMMDSMWEVLGIVASRADSDYQNHSLGLAALAIILTKGKAAPGILKAEVTAEKGILSTEKGAFSVVDWTGYPTSLPKPTGPFKLLEGVEYDAARKAANNANRALHKANPEFKGLQIHEIHPVKFGGDPTNPLNKALLTPEEHRLYNTFWFKLQNSIKK